jgi:Lrp/AsnC family leucine-responsive transcriptional regulator
MANGKLDLYDYKILNILQQDARIDASKLGRLVNLTHTPVTERMRKLQEAGFIKKYVAILDREKVGLPVLAVLMVKLRDPDTKLFETFEALLCDMREVQFVLHVSGAWNFILHVSAATNQAYHNWLMANITCHSFIATTETAFLLKDCKSYGTFKLAQP